MIVDALQVWLIAESRPFDFLTREVFDTLIIVVILIGTALAIVRLYRDFTRPLPPPQPFPMDAGWQPMPDGAANSLADDTQPTPTITNPERQTQD